MACSLFKDSTQAIEIALIQPYLPSRIYEDKNVSEIALNVTISFVRKHLHAHERSHGRSTIALLKWQDRTLSRRTLRNEWEFRAVKDCETKKWAFQNPVTAEQWISPFGTRIVILSLFELKAIYILDVYCRGNQTYYVWDIHSPTAQEVVREMNSCRRQIVCRKRHKSMNNNDFQTMFEGYLLIRYETFAIDL